MNDQAKYYQAKLNYEMDPSDLFEALENAEDIVVIDARKPSAFNEEHIPGALNIPHREMNSDTLEGLDKSKLYISYCDGIGCNASTKGALNMLKCGFNVKELIGGLKWWKLDGYATEGSDATQGLELKCAC